MRRGSVSMQAECAGTETRAKSDRADWENAGTSFSGRICGQPVAALDTGALAFKSWKNLAVHPQSVGVNVHAARIDRD